MPETVRELSTLCLSFNTGRTSEHDRSKRKRKHDSQSLAHSRATELRRRRLQPLAHKRCNELFNGAGLSETKVRERENRKRFLSPSCVYTEPASYQTDNNM